MSYLLFSIKNLLILFGCCSIIFIGCEKPNEKELPDTIVELKKIQSEKKTELKKIENTLVKIDEKIRNIDPSLFEKPVKLITGIKLAKGNFDRFIELQGAVQADETVYISSETGGRIIQLNAKEGELASKGQLIARLDLESLDKQIAEVEKSLELARQVFERQNRLWKQNIGTEIQYLQAKNNVERLEVSIETLNHQKTKANVYAPITGEIAMVNKENGEVAAPGEPIATLLNTRKLKISIDIPENLIAAVNRGDLVTVKIPAIEYEKKHRIKRIGTQINPANRTVPIEVEIYNGSGKIKPNLLATMMVKDFSSKDVIVIPNTLLQQEVSGKYFVYTVREKDKESTIIKKYVEPGESYDENIVITTGLEESDVIVSKGSRQVSEGDQVEISELKTQN